MKFVGSKAKYAKYILPIILKDRKDNQYLVDCFCGGANLIDKITGLRIANDINEYLIEMFKAVVSGWIPPDFISEQEYKDIRENKDKYPKYLVGFVSLGCSYSGKEWGGYARGNDNKGKPRNYCLESKNNILKQVESLKGVIFKNVNYWELDIPENSICYLDPPYFGVTEYKTKFNHQQFWDWAEIISKKYKVFVSEYNAPKIWTCIWEKQVYNSLTKDTGGKIGTERLFTI